MTEAEVTRRVRANLDDAAITFYTQTDISDSLRDAYYYSSIFANTIEKTATITLIPYTPYYNLSVLIPDHFAITGVYDISRSRFLSYLGRRELSQMRSDYECWKGPPEFFNIHSQTYLFIGPQPFNGSPKLKLFYRAFDDSTPAANYRLPVEGEDCLEYYATADLLEQAQEWTKAQYFWDKFHSQLVLNKIAIRNRPMPALINALAGVKL